MNDGEEPDWRRVFLEHWQLLDQLARRRFPDQNLADEAMLFAQERMARNNWERLRKFQGRSSFTTYFKVVTHHLLEDFADARFGSFSLPQWIKRMGPFWEELFRLLCRERLPVGQVLEMMCSGVPGGRTDRGVEAAISTILARETECGKSPVVESPVSHELLETTLQPGESLHHLSPEELHASKECRRLLEGLIDFLTREAPRQAGKGSRFLGALRRHMHLKPEDRLLLRLLYQEEMRMADVARLLGKTIHQINGSYRRLRQRIRQSIVTSGLEDELRQLLETLDPDG